MVKIITRYSPFLLLVGYILVLISILLPLKNTLTHPDSYIYLKYTPETLISGMLSTDGFDYKIDYLTSIKPISAIFTQVIELFNLPVFLVNAFLLLISAILLTKSNSKDNRYLKYLISGLFILNGINFYWASKLSAEFLGVFLISATYFLYKKERFNLGFLTYILLILTRSEFLLLFPLILLTNIKGKKLYIKYILGIVFCFGLISLAQNQIESFIKNIFVPLIFVSATSYVLRIFKERIVLGVKNIPIINLFFSLLTLTALVLYLFGLNNIFITPLVEGSVASIVLAIGLFLFLSIFKIQTKEKYFLLLVILGLTLIYLYTSSDNFRYFSLISPFIFALVLEFKPKKPIVNIFLVGLFMILQVSLSALAIPWDLLKENYWLDRFSTLNTVVQRDSIVVSSTPLITDYLGFTSKPICDFDLKDINSKTIIVIDGFASYLCKDKIEEIDLLRLKPVASYKTDSIVNIAKYIAVSQTTTTYIP